jgi:hypothetical protein
LLTSLLGTLWISCHQSSSVSQTPAKQNSGFIIMQKIWSELTTESYVTNIFKFQNQSQFHYLCLDK